MAIHVTSLIARKVCSTVIYYEHRGIIGAIGCLGLPVILAGNMARGLVRVRVILELILTQERPSTVCVWGGEWGFSNLPIESTPARSEINK